MMPADSATLVRQLGRQLISDAEFNERMQSALNDVHRKMRGRRAQLRPHLLIYVRRLAGLHLVDLALGVEMTESNKYPLMVAAGRQAAAFGPLGAVFFVSEAWATVYAGDEPEPKQPPADDPRRREIVLVSGLTLDLRCNHARIIIRRREDGRMFPGQTITMPYGQAGTAQQPNRMLTEFLRGYAATYLHQRSVKTS